MDGEEDEEFIAQEVEAMKSVYESDCTILRSIPPHFHLSLKPRTADVSSHQFVEIVLEVHTTPQYPKEPPCVALVDCKGLDQHRQKHLLNHIETKANELSPGLMLVALCEEAVEKLSAMNHPDGDCPLCLFPLVTEDYQSETLPFMKLMSCFHCFHSECIIRWWNWIQSSKQTGSSNSDNAAAHRNRDNHKKLEEGIGNCPVCRKPFHAKDLDHVLDLVGSHSSRELVPFASVKSENMSEDSKSYGKATDLLHQLEAILESDAQIDELGFIHPSQFSLLNEESGISTNLSDEAVHQSADRIASSDEYSKPEELYFWNRDHKLGISTHVLLPLYKAAKHAFMTAFKQYKMCGNQSDKVGHCLRASASDDHLERILLRHSRSLLLLSCDFMTAWNCRKLLVSKKKKISMFVDELLLSELVLSCSAKSEQAWSHRRWVIKSISANCSNFKGILAKESELVEKIAERSKMNYRAWNHRCWLISYMTKEQVLSEMKKSRSWAALHVSDNCCFHYRRRLLQKIMEDQSYAEATASYGHNDDIVQEVKDELDWNETLIKRYVGREALWLHRRFLSSCWINNFLTDSNDGSHHSKETTSMYSDFGTFLQKELCLFHTSTFVDDDYGDFQAQATHSASYILWLKVQIPKPLENKLLEKIADVDLKALLDKACPERSSLFNYFMSQSYVRE